MGYSWYHSIPSILQLIFVEGQDVPMMVVKSDGGFTYDTSDLAAIKWRMVTSKADWGIYVVDSGQGLHFDLLFSAGRNNLSNLKSAC